jgi:hypothetical protein
MAGTASGPRTSVFRSGFGFGIEDSEDSELDLETESGSDDAERVVGGYNLYTSSRGLLASGTIKS